MPAFTVADLVLVKARFNVPDTALEQFQAGQLLPLTVDAFANERFEGHVLSVAPAADPKARSFEVVVAIDNPTRKLRSGMIASIRVADEWRSARSSSYRLTRSSMIHRAINTWCTRSKRRTADPWQRPSPFVRPAHWQPRVGRRRVDLGATDRRRREQTCSNRATL